MTELPKEPFRSYALDEDKIKGPGKIFTIRLNADEYSQLKENMKVFNLRNEGGTLKLLADIGHNVIHGLLGAKKIKWLSDPTRRSREPK